MATGIRHARERTLLFLTTPALWPQWPFLPVVRRTRGVEELGVAFDSRAAGLTGTTMSLVGAGAQGSRPAPGELYGIRSDFLMRQRSLAIPTAMPTM
jgi:hypothetical protein